MRYYFLSIFLQIIIPSTAPQKINTGPARLVYVSVHIHMQEKTQAIINAMITRIISLFISSPCNSTWKLILQEFTKLFLDNTKSYPYFTTMYIFLQITHNLQLIDLNFAYHLLLYPFPFLFYQYLLNIQLQYLLFRILLLFHLL